MLIKRTPKSFRTFTRLKNHDQLNKTLRPNAKIWLRIIIFISYLFRAKKVRIGLEQAISEALEALELVSTLQIEVNFLLCFALFVFMNYLSEF